MSDEQLFSNYATIDYARVALTTGQMTKAPVGGASMSLSISDSPNKNTSGIYAIVNKLNGKQYIGSSENIADRWKRHYKLLQNGKHHSNHLQHAWNKYGADCFDFIVVLLCARCDLLTYEQSYIDALKPEYNTAPTAGNVTGVVRSEEYRRKQSVSQSGKTMSEETRRRISEGMKGKRNSEGATQSEETRHRKSEKLKGKQLRLGTKHSEETKQKMRAAQQARREREHNGV